ncbi:hypothetical protein FLAG1_04845 [Fusarium langsethiae]|uniref:Uncharacterized protein n=1 Tax=Fusarium langsethiae TaxID=179993 RepID=A0A0M9EY43_FUSLA|nr:hypothetical protein FLAG1_04845 [Fusarium langsethiae]GKT98000.1 unnamed protein product [Fusarium langsethiae]GKU11086.1 unnamed protein product [Fusarium langsethiae]
MISHKDYVENANSTVTVPGRHAARSLIPLSLAGYKLSFYTLAGTLSKLNHGFSEQELMFTEYMEDRAKMVSETLTTEDHLLVKQDWQYSKTLENFLRCYGTTSYQKSASSTGSARNIPPGFGGFVHLQDSHDDILTGRGQSNRLSHE